MTIRYLDRDVLQHLNSLVNNGAISSYSPTRRDAFLDLVLNGATETRMTGNVFAEMGTMPARHDGLVRWVDHQIAIGGIHVVKNYPEFQGGHAGERSILQHIRDSFGDDSISLQFDHVTVLSNDGFWANPKNADVRIDYVNSTLGTLEMMFVTGSLTVEEFVQAVHGMADPRMNNILETGVISDGTITIGERHGVEGLEITFDPASGLYLVVYGTNAAPLSGDSRILWGTSRIECFPAHTRIQTSLTTSVAISALRAGDIVLSNDARANKGRGGLVPRRVVRIYHNTTTEWVRLTWVEGGERRELVATQGHHFLDQFGQFPTIAEMTRTGRATVVLASGALAEVTAERIVYSAETAHLFERPMGQGVVMGKVRNKRGLDARPVGRSNSMMFARNIA